MICNRLPIRSVRFASVQVMVLLLSLASMLAARSVAIAQPLTDPAVEVSPPADQPTRDPETPPADATTLTPEQIAKLRRQLHTFAPYASMHNRFAFGDGAGRAAARVLTEWTEIRETNENAFDASKPLQSAYRDLRAFMVKSEGPALQALEQMRLPQPTLGPATGDPFIMLAELMFISAAEIGRSQVLSQWSHDHDDVCRAAYKRLLPDLRRVVDRKRPDKDVIHLRHWFLEGRGVYLEVVNRSGQDLTNVTLVVRLGTLSGEASDHYFFLPTWPGGNGQSGSERYAIRLSRDWESVTAAATTSALIEVISDQLCLSETRFEINDHIPSAADRLLRINRDRLAQSRFLALAVRDASRLESKLADYPERLLAAKELRKDADARLKQIIEAANKRIEGHNKRIDELMKPRRKGENITDEASDQIRKTRKAIDAERILIADYKGGKR